MPATEETKQAAPPTAPNGTATPPAPVADPSQTALAPAPAAGTMTIVDDDPGGSTAVNSFSSATAFATAQRMAMALSRSSLVPKDYQGNISNCLIAIEMASRVQCSVFAVMQNLDIIHGRPGWRSQFLIATVNACGRFTPLRFRWQSSQGKPDWGCRAVAKDKADGEECLGSLITMETAKVEGWYDRGGSKWKTIPEQMLMYRAAAFWTRVYAPELSLGMHTADEAEDIGGTEPVLLAPVPYSGDPATEGRRMPLGNPHVKRLDPSMRVNDAEVVTPEPPKPEVVTPVAQQAAEPAKKRGQQALKATPAEPEDRGDEPGPGEMGDRDPGAEG